MSTPINDNPFGKLSFSSHSFETDAEKCVTVLHAAFKVHGIQEDSKTLKLLKRLKRSMSKNKVHRYSFTIVSTEEDDVGEEPRSSVLPLEETPDSAYIIKQLSSLLHVRARHKCMSTTSSKYLVMRAVCVGRSKSFPLDFSLVNSKLREAGFTFSSFSVLDRENILERDAVRLTVQCIFAPRV